VTSIGGKTQSKEPAFHRTQKRGKTPPGREILKGRGGQGKTTNRIDSNNV